MKETLLVLIMALTLGSLGFFRFDRRSCAGVKVWKRSNCREMEAAILASTVRIVFHGWLEIEEGSGVKRIPGTVSHATAVDGRYLITHNHFTLPLAHIVRINEMGVGGLTGVSVVALDGTPLLDRAPLDAFTVVSEEGETMVLDFGRPDGSSPLARSGSAMLRKSEPGSPGLVAGAEVALVDWDGRGNTRVVWSKVLSVGEYESVPVIRVDHLIEYGASGGGVFLNGEHIGNNWARITVTNRETGVVERRLTMVALDGNLDPQFHPHALQLRFYMSRRRVAPTAAPLLGQTWLVEITGEISKNVVMLLLIPLSAWSTGVATHPPRVIHVISSGDDTGPPSRGGVPGAMVLFDPVLADQQLILPQAGAYTLTLSGNNLDATGTYSFALQEGAGAGFVAFLPLLVRGKCERRRTLAKIAGGSHDYLFQLASLNQNCT